MAERKKYLFAELTILLLIITGSIAFFGIFYRYHIFLIEQLQTFLLNVDYFVKYLSKPGFLSSYIGDFLTQFYYLNFGGAVVITAVLILLWLVVRKLISKLSCGSASNLFAYLPVVLSMIALCDPEFPVSNVISLIISVICTLIYISITSPRVRIITGIVMVVLLYITAGSSFYFFTLSAISFEIFKKQTRGKWFISFLLLAVTIFIPLDLKGIYLLTPVRAFTYLSEMSDNPGLVQFLPLISLGTILIWVYVPVKILRVNGITLPLLFAQAAAIIILLSGGVKMKTDFSLEKILHLDYEASHNRWDIVLDLSQKYKMRNNVSSYFTNMALAKLGLMPDELMEFYQPAATGLFIPVNANENYMTITFSNEVYWQLGDVNASQHSALLGMIFSPRGQNSRLLKRLAEINIVNGEYAAAGKFLNILEKTMFYRKWAQDRVKYLNNEAECSSAKWITDKRAIIPEKDMLKKGNEYIKTLRMLADNHPDNRMAVDYLLCYQLLIKDIPAFKKDFDKYYGTDRNILLPKVYQEGLLIRIASGQDKVEDYKRFIFSPEIIKSMTEYTKEYEAAKGKGADLYDKYGMTYWFYYHFATMKTE
jgi:hypothetical protein